jgi:hypothetical protein
MTTRRRKRNESSDHCRIDAEDVCVVRFMMKPSEFAAHGRISYFIIARPCARVASRAA